MSPDQYYKNPKAARLQSVARFFVEALPELAFYVLDHPSDFVGVTAFLGEGGDIVVGFRVFGNEGQPLICWTSGDDFVDALVNLDKKVGSGGFKKDKKQG